MIPREANEPEMKPGFERQAKGEQEHSFHDPRNPYHNDKSPKSMSYGGQHDKLEGIAGYVPTQRLEWKRYKQYTRNDIMQAIEEVKKGRCLNSPAAMLLLLSSKVSPFFVHDNQRVYGGLDKLYHEMLGRSTQTHIRKHFWLCILYAVSCVIYYNFLLV